MPRYRTLVGQNLGMLTSGLLGGYGGVRNMGQRDAYQAILMQNQAEKAGLESDLLRREINRDPYTEAIRDLGVTGGDADNYRKALTGQTVEGLDPNKVSLGLKLLNVYSRGGKVDDLVRAAGEANRNNIAFNVNPQNAADVGAMIGATEGKPLEGVKAQVLSRIANGEESQPLVKGLLAAAGKGIYDNMPGGVFNVDSGQQNINAIGESVIGKNNAQAYKAQKPSGVNAKPMPTPALKLVNEELNVLGTVKGTNSDINSIIKQIDNGKLDLSLSNNLSSKVRNFVGASNDASRNYDAFMSTLEKMRNDTLMLAKGVQTEGDAQRAWNQLMSSPNDAKNVKQQLERIKKINERSASLRALNIDNIRANYGLDPMDLSKYIDQPSAIEGGGIDWQKVNDPQAEIRQLQQSGDYEAAKQLQDMVNRQSPGYSDEDLQHTAQKYGITVEQVKARLGVK